MVQRFGDFIVAFASGVMLTITLLFIAFRRPPSKPT